jgi:hypothetical protein
MFVLTGKIGYRENWNGKHIVRVELRNNDYQTIDELVWRDATTNDMNSLVFSAMLKKRP